MPFTRLIIKNFKSIKKCDISLSELNVIIGENGTGKTNLLAAISYFYHNLTNMQISEKVFDENNRYSNECRISLVYDFSELVKISKSNADEAWEFQDERPTEKTRYSGYYKTIISMAERTRDKRVYVELSQIKGKTIQWNCPYEERMIIKSLFPIFYIDTRNLDVTEWNYVWSILGELAKVSNADRKKLETKIGKILLDDEHETSRKLKVIKDIFSAADVSVQPAMSKEFATNLAKIFFSGETIQQRGKQLEYYSTGTNSVKYIEILIKSIDALSRTKLKEPIVLFDEPETSLHTSYLDELAEAIIGVGTRMSIIISTHSPRLTKNLLISNRNTSLYNVKLVDNYSTIYPMKKFTVYSPTSKYRVTDEHINSYFSKAALFVEGETEQELFANPYIKLLFPKLKKVEVFKAVSDKPILNIMDPAKVHIRTPYMCLIDLDKVIEYNKGIRKFNLRNEYLSESKKECYQYRNKSESGTYLYFQRKRINAMGDGLRVHYYTPFYSCNDADYLAFVSAIQKYLLAYNVFCLSSTIEGSLVNGNTVDYAMNFLETHTKQADFEEFKRYWDTLKKTDKINVLRIMYNGKSDLLMTWKSLSKKLDVDVKDILAKNIIGKKTSGWVSEYLDEFFRLSAGLEEPISEKLFRKYLASGNNRANMVSLFSRNFPELYSLIDKLCDMIYE